MWLGTGTHISAGTAGEAAPAADQSRDGDGGEPVRSPSKLAIVYCES